MDSEAPYTRKLAVCALHGRQYERSDDCPCCRDAVIRLYNRRMDWQRRSEGVRATESAIRTIEPKPYRSPELRFVIFLGKAPLKLAKLVGMWPWWALAGPIHASLVLHGRKGLWHGRGGWWDVGFVDMYRPGIKKGIEWRDEFRRI